MQEKISLKCPYCQSSNIRKEGKRKNKLQTIQKYFCKDCGKNFADKRLEHKTYPSRVILNAILFYNLGYTQTEVSKLISQRFKIKVPQRTISEWVKEHKAICTFYKLRKEAIKLYSPKNIISKKTLNHIQPYTFKYHKAKLYLLFYSIKYNNQFHNIAHFYDPLKSYLEKINSKDFPHHIFTYAKRANESGSSPNAEIDNKNFNDSIKNNQGNIGKGQNEKTVSATEVAQNNLIFDNAKTNSQRASQVKFNHLEIKNLQKNNFACNLAKLALNLANSNKQRHEAIQDFFLINDTTTIAVEVPVYLTNWDAGYYKNQNGFIFPLRNYKTPIIGHIDILQIRNGLMHIFDYKPEADKQNPIEQLTIYALALSRKLNLPLYFFKCPTCEARFETRSPCHWFDEINYYEFFPLHAVYERKRVKTERFK